MYSQGSGGRNGIVNNTKNRPLSLSFLRVLRLFAAELFLQVGPTPNQEDEQPAKPLPPLRRCRHRLLGTEARAGARGQARGRGLRDAGDSWKSQISGMQKAESELNWSRCQRRNPNLRWKSAGRRASAAVVLASAQPGFPSGCWPASSNAASARNRSFNHIPNSSPPTCAWSAITATGTGTKSTGT